MTGTYYAVCHGLHASVGLGNITMTNPDYQVYHGVDLTANKRFSNKWQLQVGVTIQTNPNYFPEYRRTFIDPQGREFSDGRSTIARYVSRPTAATRSRGTSRRPPTSTSRKARRAR